MALTIAQIHAAASAIDATGQKPTLAGVRAKLGSGSYSTISAALQTWERVGEEEVEDLPSDIPDDVQASADLLTLTIWQLAVKTAREAHNVECQKFAVVIAGLTEQIRVFQLETASMEAEIIGLEGIEGNLRSDFEDCKLAYVALVNKEIVQRTALGASEKLASERLRTIEAMTIATSQFEQTKKPALAKPKLPSLKSQDLIPADHKA